MNTRHTQDSTLHDNRYMSDPDFVEARGISGSAVATKAACISERHRRSLIFFLQSLSIEQRGTKRLAQELLRLYADRVGTPAMHRFGMKKGQAYSAEQVREVRRELGVRKQFPLMGEYEPSFRHDEDEHLAEVARCKAEAQKLPDSYPAAAFAEICRERLERQLPEFLIELCIDPKLEVIGEGETSAAVLGDRWEVMAEDEKLTANDFRPAGLIVFRDIVGTLFEFKQRYETQARERFAMTSIGRSVWAALDYGLKTRKMILVQGDSGVGKTSAVEAWCDCHRGEVRYARLSGINGRRAFFGELARPCGVGSTAGLSPEKIQARVERFLETSGLMLVIDEAQYLWPQGARIRRHPELVNWLNTACANEGIPVALIATDEFNAQRRNVEAQTTWNSFQMARRIRRVFQLSAMPNAETEKDLTLVARKLLPGGTEPMVNYVVGYAMLSKRFMQGVVDCIDDARLIAEEAGHERPTAGDLKRAVGDWRAASDASMKRIFSAGAGSPIKRGRKPRLVQDASADDAAPPQADGSEAAEEFHHGPLEVNRVEGRDLAGV